MPTLPTEKERGDLTRSRAGKVDAFPAVLSAIALLMTIGMAFLVQDRLRAKGLREEREELAASDGAASPFAAPPPKDELDWGEPANEHCGAVEEWGEWRQTKDEVELYVSVPEGTRAKSVKCVIKPTSLSLSLRAPAGAGEDAAAVEVGGELWAMVNVEESTWTMEDGRVCVSLLKHKANTERREFWRAALRGGGEINTVRLDSPQTGPMGPSVDVVDPSDPDAVKNIIQQLKAGNKAKTL